MVEQGVCGMEVPPQRGPGAEPRWGSGAYKYNEILCLKTNLCALSVCILFLKHAVKLTDRQRWLL